MQNISFWPHGKSRTHIIFLFFISFQHLHGCCCCCHSSDPANNRPYEVERAWRWQDNLKASILEVAFITSAHFQLVRKSHIKDVEKGKTVGKPCVCLQFDYCRRKVAMSIFTSVYIFICACTWIYIWDII